MHCTRDLRPLPLCCLPAAGSPPPPSVAGLLYKWTNIAKGWRPRWFAIRGALLAYSKLRRRRSPPLPQQQQPAAATRLIGPAQCAQLGRPIIGLVHLKISTFRRSRSDDRRFYIITPTKTLQLRTDSANDRVAWIEALVSARTKYSPSGGLLCDQNDVPFSTERLRNRMHAEGLDEEIIKDCEQIVHSEFSQYSAHMKHPCEEYLSFLGSRQQLENMQSWPVNQLETDCYKNCVLVCTFTFLDIAISFHGFMLIYSAFQVLNTDFTANVSVLHPHLMKSEHSCSRHGKCSECTNAESSDDFGQQELDELSDDDNCHFYDTRQSFGGSVACPHLEMKSSNSGKDNCLSVDNFVKPKVDMGNNKCLSLSFKRRTKLPVPVEEEKGVSLWSMIKDNVGKDLTRVCLPVYFNEPLSSLQKCFEELEYSYLLDRAYECGIKGNNLMRILYVAAFAVSGYASSDGRPCKPFNPLLGETYEAYYPEIGIRFFSEKVSHHPMVMACHCEGKCWKFWGDTNVKSKFWGQTIQLEPAGVLTLEFDDGEIFQWSKVTTRINNLIIGRVYCHHHGTMDISGNRGYSCKLTFKQQSFLERNPRQVEGFVKDISGAKVATVTGKWDESVYCTTTNDALQINCSTSGLNAGGTLLWQKNEPSANPTRYNLSSFAISLNELTPELKEKLPPTDSRLRPDQRHLENGEYDKANAEKLRLEARQRMSRKMQDNGWKPRWFERDSEGGTFRYSGGYWEARGQGK